MCGAHHMAKDKSSAECARMCVKQEMKYALVVGNKVYTLEGHEAELDKLAGDRATVKGEVTGETVDRSVCRPGTLTMTMAEQLPTVRTYVRLKFIEEASWLVI